MDTSFALARLIGPVLLLLVLSVAVDRTRLAIASRELLASPALIFLTALLSLVAGLAIVIGHNLWSADWRLLLTLFGWLLTVAGAVRMVMPRLVQRQGNALMNRVWPMWVVVAITLALGLLFTWQGYFGAAPAV
jgi:hypothetical protein